MIAPPWLALPVKGYGGIELVMQTLIKQLVSLGHEVVVYGNGERSLKGVVTKSIYTKEVIEDIYRPLNESIVIPMSHVMYALHEIKNDGHFDIIHSHVEFIAPPLLAWASQSDAMPPIVHTLHGPPFAPPQRDDVLPDVQPYWQQLARDMGKVYLVGISESLVEPAPAELKKHILPSVYNALDVDSFPFVKEKKNYFFTLARFNHEKAQHIAAQLCAEKGYHLRMAGTVAGIETNQRLLYELANPMSRYRNSADFRYYSDNILKYVLDYPKITYSGNVSGANKMQFLSQGKALLFPIQWEEPFGMAVIEALACGTPVVAMNRGAMSEIIEHGVTGFLANNEQEFADYMERVGEIDPAACRQAVRDKFTVEIMAEGYVERYREAIRRSR